MPRLNKASAMPPLLLTLNKILLRRTTKLQLTLCLPMLKKPFQTTIKNHVKLLSLAKLKSLSHNLQKRRYANL